MFSIRLNKNIFINLKQILLNIIMFGGILFLGKFLKDGIGILSFIIFIWLMINQKRHLIVYFLIIWLYLNNYYIGQMYITRTNLYNILFNGKLYTLIFFVSVYKSNWLHDKFNKKLIYWSLGFVVFALISNILHLKFKIGFLNQANVILMFLIILNLKGSSAFNQKILTLLISLGFLEVIISYLQVFQILPAPMKNMSEIAGQYYLHIAGLDDVASGTFGANASNVTSWFETVLFLFFFSVGLFKKNFFFVLLSFVFLTQYGSVDSKTALGVTGLSFLVLLRLLQKSNMLKFKNIINILLFLVFAVIMVNIIKNYYETNFRKGTTGVDVQLSESFNVIINNIGDWGKIAGFKYISEDWLQSGNSINFLIGYGKGNFEYYNNSGRIESMDTPFMQLNNITRSRSAFIKIFGTFGVPGLFFLLWLFIILWKDIRKRKFNNILGMSFKTSGTAILFGSFVFMFLYGGHSYKDLAFQAFLILYAIVLRVEKGTKFATI